eukprot:7641711-Ditylum_brightwellii.AAC.1
MDSLRSPCLTENQTGLIDGTFHDQDDESGFFGSPVRRKFRPGPHDIQLSNAAEIGQMFASKRS